MDRPLKDKDINDLLIEEIPQDFGCLTDIESDDDDEIMINVPPTTFDKVFQEQLEDVIESLPVDMDSDEMEELLDEPSHSPQPEPSSSTPIDASAHRPKPTAQKSGKKALKKHQEPNRHWRKREVNTCIPTYSGKEEGPVDDHFASCKTATDVFTTVIEPAIAQIVYQSNLYAVQQNKILNINSNDMYAFLGINFQMGYVVMPSWKDYWSTSPDLGSPLIKDTMSRNRFENILNYLHVNDNILAPKDCLDKLYKLRPLIDTMNGQFTKIYNITREVSIDESIILFKGRSVLKQYNPMKPIKRGFKLWCMADQRGYISNFEVYQGKSDKQVPEEFLTFGLGERVVLQLTKPYWGTWLTVYFDNYYSSLRLVEKLKCEQILACGTIKKERKGLPILAVDKDLSRGDYDYRHSNLDIGVYKWIDNRPVYFVSNFHGTEKSVVQRTNKEGRKLDIPCPSIVKDYNSHMGGVDLADQLRQLYCVNRKSRKWWHRIFWGIIDIAFVNSYIIYNSLYPENKLTVLQYRRCVSQGLMAKVRKPQNKRSLSKVERTPSTSQPKRGHTCSWSVSDDVRLGNRGVHYVEFVSKRGRCEVCGKRKIESRPHSICNMCKVYLCVNEKKNCFKEFHDY